MPYEHGARVNENPTSLPTPAASDSGVCVVIGTAPINLVSNPAGVVNKPVLCHDFNEAKAAFGYSDDYANYTLCEAMDSFFKVFGVGPVVLINVLDPTTHKSAYTETLTVTDGKAVSTTLGVLLSGLTLKNGETTLVEGEDYIVSFDDDGYLVVSVITSEITTINATGFKLNPSGVAASDIIGSVDSETGAETGLELIRQVFPTFGIVPSLIVAPRFSATASVGIAMAAKCTDINGSFSAECVVDLDTNTVRQYTDVPDAKEDAGYVSEHMICLWPKVKITGKVMDYSALYAAMVVATDIVNDDVPFKSPSNEPLGISATVLADGTEVVMDEVQANTLNARGIVTAINFEGYKSWGNNTAVYPASDDPKDRWISCRRFFSWQGNRFIRTYHKKVDNPMNFRLIQSIVDAENIFGNSLVSQQMCASAKIIYDPAQSVPVEGRVKFKQLLAPLTPAEYILNTLEFDVTSLNAALNGGE